MQISDAQFGMIYGYARVSTAAQDETGQVRQLKTAGCEKVFREKITGTTADPVAACRADEERRGGQPRAPPPLQFKCGVSLASASAFPTLSPLPRENKVGGVDVGLDRFRQCKALGQQIRITLSTIGRSPFTRER